MILHYRIDQRFCRTPNYLIFILIYLYTYLITGYDYLLRQNVICFSYETNNNSIFDCNTLQFLYQLDTCTFQNSKVFSLVGGKKNWTLSV